MSLFSKNLRFLRKKGKHNQEEISRLFNKKANTVGNWENEKSEPSLRELIRLGEFFHVSVQDLLHTELENSGTAKGLQAYEVQEPEVTHVREAPADAFWLILRELRMLNEKVDLLSSGTDSPGFKKNSDKSYH